MKNYKCRAFSCKLSYEDHIMLQKIIAKEKMSGAEFLRKQIRDYGVDNHFKLAYLKLNHYHKDMMLIQKLLSLLVSLQYESEPTDDMIEKTINFIKGMKKKIYMES